MGAEMNVELLPCPFCGNDTASVQDSYISGGGHMVLCPSCTAEGPLCTDEMAAIGEWNRRAAQPADVGAKQVPTNPICERKTNDIMQREGYQKTGYVLMKDDPAARICVSDQGAVSWFTRDQWNWLMHNRDHVEFQWPKPLGVRLSEASPQAAQGVSAADAVSLMLWLYRRLPRAYGRPPHVEAPIAAMAKIAGIDVADSFSERDPAPPLSSEQQAEKGEGA